MLHTLLGLLLAVTCGLQHAQAAEIRTYPVRPVKLVTGNSPGSQSDQLARLLGAHLSRQWGQSVVVENRPGAGGTIAAETVAQAPADGYTLFLGGQSNLVLAAMPGNQLRYDPARDFAPIGRIAQLPLGLVVHPSVKAATFPELAALAKDQPGRLTIGSSGLQSRLAGELLKASTGADIVEIPYKGTAPLLVDLLAGRIDMTFTDLSIVASHLRSGALRMVPAAVQSRREGAPMVHTVADRNLGAPRVMPWYGLVAPARTPPEVLAILRSALAEFRRSPEIRQRFEQLGYEPIDDSAEEFGTAIASEIRGFSALFEQLGIRLDPN